MTDHTELLERLDKPINTDEFARAIYQKQCDYVGQDHEGKCVEYLREMLSSYEKDFQNSAKAIRELQSESITKELHNTIVRRLIVEHVEAKESLQEQVKAFAAAISERERIKAMGEK